MNLHTLQNTTLLNQLVGLVKSERKMTHTILNYINEVQNRRLFAELGYDSMFKFLTKHLGYSEDSAYRRLKAAKLLQSNPDVAKEISEKIEEGKINLTQLAQVQREVSRTPHTQINTLDLIHQIEAKSNFETQQIIASNLNIPIESFTKIKPQADGSCRLEITFTSEQMVILTQAKGICSTSVPSGNWAEVLTYLAQFKISKSSISANSNSDPKSDTTGTSTSTSTSTSTGTKLNARIPSANQKTSSTQLFMAARNKKNRKYISINTKRNLLTHANHCCQFVDKNSGRRCGSQYQLQIDHIKPIALGGTDDVSNLRILCRTHNLLAAKNAGLWLKK